MPLCFCYNLSLLFVAVRMNCTEGLVASLKLCCVGVTMIKQHLIDVFCNYFSLLNYMLTHWWFKEWSIQQLAPLLIQIFHSPWNMFILPQKIVKQQVYYFSFVYISWGSKPQRSCLFTWTRDEKQQQNFSWKKQSTINPSVFWDMWGWSSHNQNSAVQMIFAVDILFET